MKVNCVQKNRLMFSISCHVVVVVVVGVHEAAETDSPDTSKATIVLTSQDRKSVV